jgi:adenylate kinase family enzyme
MARILIFGNSGSGKTTLAKRLSRDHVLAHLDLDELAWLKSNPPQRAPLEESGKALKKFVETHNTWVIEGCYSDLLALLQNDADEIIFLNLPIELCAENARQRTWEPHKYLSKQVQDKNLQMLLDWIDQYESREDVFSLSSHLAFFEQFAGKKQMLVENQ